MTKAVRKKKKTRTRKKKEEKENSVPSGHKKHLSSGKKNTLEKTHASVENSACLDSADSVRLFCAGEEPAEANMSSFMKTPVLCGTSEEFGAFSYSEKYNMSKEFSRSLTIKKLTEAGFSDIFLIDGLIVKIIKIEDDESSGCTIEDFSREVFAMTLFARLGATVDVKRTKICEGAYPPRLLRAWKIYAQEKSGADPENVPDSNSERYGIIWMENGGEPLETFSPDSLDCLVEILLGLCRILAELEERCEFEHRDLHPGNILVKKNSAGLKISLIDFSISRFRYRNSVVFQDLDKIPWIFDGDEHIDIQYSVYKKMKKTIGTAWNAFFPVSNAIWITHTAEKMYDSVLRPKNSTCYSANGDTAVMSAFLERALGRDGLRTMSSAKECFACIKRIADCYML